MGAVSPIVSPRHGLRALVTRPRAEAGTLADALAARGIAAIIEPLLDIHYRTVPPPDLAGVQAIMCTSTNGVRALARLSGERRVPLFAVGETSAARARDAGFIRVESAGGTVDDLIHLAFERLRPSSGRLLHVAGSIVAGDLTGGLQARGFAVDRAVLYEARPATGLSAATARAIDAGLIDFALFFSPRTAAIFARLAEHAGLAAKMRFVTAISLSAAADAGLGDLPFRERQIAGRPDQPGLLLELDQMLVERRHA